MKAINVVPSKRIRRPYKFLVRENIALPHKKREHYLKYLKRQEIKKEEEVSKDAHKKIVAEIYKQIENSLVENSAGVLIKGFGYFSVQMKTTKTLPKKRSEKVDNYRYGEYKFYASFIPYEDDSDLKFCSMEYSFSKNILEKVREKIITGHKYYCFRDSLRKYLQLPDKVLAYRKKMRKKSHE